MKKIITLFSFILALNFFNAQVFFENWDDAQAWTTNDADGDGNDWQIADFVDVDPTTNLDGFGSAVFSESWDDFTGLAVTPDNYLISPALNLSGLSGSLQLNYEVAAVDPAFPNEFYTLYVITDTSDFNTAVEIHSEMITVGNQIFNLTFDISAFLGQSAVHIMFRHHNSTDNFRIAFDNIGVYHSDFASDILTGSVCQTYTFTDNSVGASSWAWDFGADATPQTANTAGPHQVTYSSIGLKTVTLTTDGLVTETKTDYIDVSLLDDASFSFSSANFCLGSSNELATVTGLAGGTFSSPTPGFVLDANTGEIDLSNSPVASYDVTYTTPVSACQNSATTTVNIVLDNVLFSYPQSNFCPASANEVATITGVAGGTFSSTTPGFIVDINSGEIDLANSPDGTYDVTYTNPTAICQTSSTVSIVIGPEDPTFSYAQTNYCIGSANESATISGFTGGTFSSTTPGFILDANTGEIDLSTFPAATYDVTYTTSGSACQNSSTISIVIGLDDAGFSYSNTEYCFGSANEVATITGVDGGSFSSTDPAFVIDATTGEIALSSMPAGSYDVSYSTPAGVCQNTQTVTITIFDQFIIDPILPQEVCVGGMTNAITFSGTGSGAPGNTGLSFDWEYTTQPIAGTDIGLPFTGTGDIPAFQTINTGTDPIIATFTLTPGDGVCGGAPITFTITVNPLDNASFNYPQTAYCFGASADELPMNLLSSGVFSSSTPGFVDALSGSIAVSTFPVASYDVTFTTTGNCPNSSMLFIDINATDDPSFAYSALEYCQFGTNPIPVPVLAGGTYSSGTADLMVDPITGEIDLSNSLQGNYSITYTTAGTCPDFSFQQVEVRGAAFVDPIADVPYCEGENSVAISFTGSAATTFSWSNTDPTIGLAASGSGDIPSFVVSNGTGGAITATIEVTPDDGVCPGNPVSFDFTVNTSADPSFTLSSLNACSGTANVTATIDGTANGIFSATGGLNIDASSGEIDVINSMPGVYDVSYEVGAGTCQISSTVSFEIIETPVIAPIFDVTICSGDIVPNLNLDVLSTYAVEWTNDNVTTGIVNINGIGDIPSFIANNPVLGDIPQVSTITLIADNNGCLSLPEVFTVTVNPNPVVNGGANVVQCSGNPLIMTATGTPGTIFTWDNNITQGVAFTPTEGTYIYTVTGTLNGCSSFDQVDVQINLTPTVSAGTDRVVCAGSITTLTGSGAPILTWNNGVFDNIPFLPSVTQTYTLTGQSAAGCTSTDDVEIVVEDLPTPSFTADMVSACSPATIIFNSNNTTNGCVYSFSDGTTEIGCFNVAHTFTEVGTYDVTLTQSSINLCVGTITIPAMITINPDPVASFEPTKSTVDMIDPTTYFENTSVGAVSYEWNFGDNSGVIIDDNPSHSFPADEAGEYSVRLIAISPFGCRDTSYQIIILEESLIAYIPNSFTPNGDEFNNSFTPQFYSGLDPQTYNMKIFNRFGQLIFESNDAKQGWDGDFGAGRGLTDTGVYTYKIEFSTSSKDEKKMLVGNVNLLR
jgi:gliding motility-associated-like protein